MARTFDPIELELLWRRLISMVDEAAAAMVRTSFSTLVRESYDFSCVITDASGQSLVQASESIPSFIGTLPETVKHFLRFFPPDQLAPGVSIEGPAVFEEDESTFIVGPGATARLLADGSILAEVV